MQKSGRRELAQIDPKLLQKEIDRLSKVPVLSKKSSTLVPDSVKPKEDVENALFVDKNVSTDLTAIMRAVNEVKRSGATEAQAEVNANQRLR